MNLSYQQSTQWYQSAVDELTRIAAAMQRQEHFDLKRLSSLASDMVESLNRGDQLVVEALAGSSGSPLITNLINVGILATKVGVGLGHSGMELERLALAGLVHDIGLFAFPQSLVTKDGHLTPEERMLIEQHPEVGYQALGKLGTTHEWLAEVVRQAHERWNGQGYPNKLKGRQIKEFAQIIGVVDVFEALVSPRPYRRRFLPHEAVRELVAVERTAFRREVVKALVEQLSAYPIGTSVRLSTGELGTVIRVNTHFPLRPVVLIGESRTEDLAARQVDLSTSPRVTIIETVAPPDVARLSFPIRAVLPPVTGHPYRFPAVLSPRNRAALDAIANVIQEVVESVAPVRRGLDRLSEGETTRPPRRTAIQNSFIEAPSSHSLSNRQQAAAPQPVIQSSEASEPPLLKALRALQQARARSVQPTRDVLEAVILRAGHEAGEIGVSVIEHILNELDRLDEQFIEDVRRRVPVIVQALHNLRSQETTGFVTASHIDPIVCEVDALYDLANRVEASMMTMFLHALRSLLRDDLANRVEASMMTTIRHGLRSLFLARADRKASTLPQWLEMVEARVQTLIPMAEQWVNIGRTERADISEMLRA